MVINYAINVLYAWFDFMRFESIIILEAFNLSSFFEIKSNFYIRL